MTLQTRVRTLAALFTFLAALGPFSSQAEQEGTSKVSVVFVNPETFTDAGYSKIERSSPAILLQLQRFIVETATRQLPESLHLEIKITDIDLAGDFEVFRGPQFEHVRVNKSIYPPRIVLDFRVLDAGRQSVRHGHRELSDLNYQLRVVSQREDPLRHEKELLQDWLKQELTVLSAEKTK
ncbi:MAG TPA: DUF3016 domain-containing protein [Candidatus Polarisedimenticolaceae bacterium]|nr:DUF3016 domain-containing protein [Candidatus Polarisedimenticolaceae bacterium]